MGKIEGPRQRHIQNNCNNGFNWKSYQQNEFNRFERDFVSPYCITGHPQDSTPQVRQPHSEREAILRPGHWNRI